MRRSDMTPGQVWTHPVVWAEELMDHWPKMPNQSRETALEQSSQDIWGCLSPALSLAKGREEGLSFQRLSRRYIMFHSKEYVCFFQIRRWPHIHSPLPSDPGGDRV